jgi:hypothetical protein
MRLSVAIASMSVPLRWELILVSRADSFEAETYALLLSGRQSREPAFRVTYRNGKQVTDAGWR